MAGDAVTPASVSAWAIRLQVVAASAWVLLGPDLPLILAVWWAVLAWIFLSAANGIDRPDA